MTVKCEHCEQGTMLEDFCSKKSLMCFSSCEYFKGQLFVNNVIREHFFGRSITETCHLLILTLELVNFYIFSGHRSSAEEKGGEEKLEFVKRELDER